jgi:hypothetical protein
MTNREQGPGYEDQDLHRTKELMRSALRPVGGEPELHRDLWPAMLRRMDEHASRGPASVPWFDWALGGALLAFAAIVPRTIPVILYYL